MASIITRRRSKRRKKAAEAAGVRAIRVTFDVASAEGLSSRAKNYALVAFFDCLHDMGDPAGAAKHVHSTLASDGAWMVVEPAAGDKITDNPESHWPRGSIRHPRFICTPASRSQEVGLGLGAQAGQARLTKVIKDGGFSSVRRAAETPFNMVLEARP